MSLHRTRELVHTLQVLAVQTSIRTSVRCKNSESNYWKRFKKITVLTYGKLLETTKEKNDRLKRKEKLSKTESPVVTKNMGMDAELAWIMKVTRKKYLRRIRIEPAIATTVEQSSSNVLNVDNDKKRTKSMVVKDTRPRRKELRSNAVKSRCEESQEIYKKEIKSTNVDVERLEANNNGIKDTSILRDSIKGQDSTTNRERKSNSLPGIIVRNVTSFSIFDSSKKLAPEIQGQSKVLSLSQYDDQQSMVFPSVTRILSATMSDQSKLNLELWKRKMIEKLGEDGFLTYQKELLENGKLLHASIQNALMQTSFDVPETVKLSFESVQSVLKDITNVMAIETHVVHPKLRYRGIVDCIALYKGNPCVIDWKKSDKPKTTMYSTYDAPVQVASYIGASNADKNYPFEIKNGVIVVAYTNGDSASVHELSSDNLQKYWRFWLKRLQEYYVGLEQCDSKTNS